MKQRVSLLLAGVLLASLTACSSGQKPAPNGGVDLPGQAVPTEEPAGTEMEVPVDLHGTATYSDGTVDQVRMANTFDEAGRIIRQDTYYNDELTRYVVKTYDAEGNLSMDETYLAGEEELCISTTKYNARGQVIEDTRRQWGTGEGGKDTILSEDTTYYEYDEEGRCIAQTGDRAATYTYDMENRSSVAEGGSVWCNTQDLRVTTTYTKDWKPLVITMETMDGTPYGKATYEYDLYGRPVLETAYYEDWDEAINATMKYDDNDYLIYLTRQSVSEASGETVEVYNPTLMPLSEALAAQAAG